MPRFTQKMNVFPTYVLGHTTNVCWNPQNSTHFSQMINLRGHMPRFTWKMNVFLTYVLGQHHKCVLKPSEQCSFFLDNWFEGSHAYLYSKNEHCSIYLLRNTINVCWNPQNSARFSKTIDLRGHMIRFTEKMNVLPSISWETPYMCVETLRTVLVFTRWSIWVVTGIGLVGKCTCFLTYVLGTHHKCGLKSLRTVLVFPRWSIWGRHMPRFTQKMNVFPSISLRNPIYVCWNPQNSAHFYLRRSIWVVTCIGLLWKINIFPPLCMSNTHKCVLKQSEHCSFLSETIYLKGSHA